MLYILLEYAKPQKTLKRVMEFTGPGLATLSMDERATLTNMATECSARTAIVEADERPTTGSHGAARSSTSSDAAAAVRPIPRPTTTAVSTHRPVAIEPMVAHPGDPDRGIPSDPTNGALVTASATSPIDIAYGGSCTAGKIDDLSSTTRSSGGCRGRSAGRRRGRLPDPVRLPEVRGLLPRARLPRDLRRAGVRSDPARLRRLHRLRSRCVRDHRAGDGVGDQPQLQGPLGSRPALPGVALDGRGVGLHRPHLAYRPGMFAA